MLLFRHRFIDLEGAALIVASMGASAVLLFAVPHAPLSQPWPLIGGHVVSALVGVICAKVILNAPLAAALAVSLAIGSMHYFRCIHPPGGVTALTAVIGGASVDSLDYTSSLSRRFS
jgi:CBS domain-containing membrane protein